MGTDLQLVGHSDPQKLFGKDLTFPGVPFILTLLEPEFLGDPNELRLDITGRHVGYQRLVRLDPHPADNGHAVMAAMEWDFVDWRTFRVPNGGGLIKLEVLEKAVVDFLAPTDYRVTAIDQASGLAFASRPIEKGYTVRLLPGFCKRRDVPAVGDRVVIDSVNIDRGVRTASSWTFEQSPAPAKTKREPKPGMVEIAVTALDQEKGFAFGWFNEMKILFHPNQYRGEDLDLIRVDTTVFALIESGPRGYRATEWYEA